MTARQWCLVAFCSILGWVRGADTPFSGLAQIAVKVSDPAQSDRFYRDVLGFDRLPADSMETAWYKVNETQCIALQPGRTGVEDHRLVSFSLATDDIGRASAWLSRRVTVRPEVSPGNDGNLHFTLRDPDGNCIVVTQVVPGSVMDRHRDLRSSNRLSNRLRHVGIKVSNLEAAAAFYRDKLGLRVEEHSRGDLRWIDMHLPGGDYIQMQAARKEHVGKRLWSLEHFGLDVDDAHATYTLLSKRGAARDGRFRPAVGYAGHLKINFMDPDDTMIELMELGLAAAGERREK